MAQLQQEPEREVVIYKIEGEPLGISIKGVQAVASSWRGPGYRDGPGVTVRFFKHSYPGGKEHDLPILISEVKEGSAMARSRKCFVGDEVLAVEDEPLADLEHSEASALLRNAAGSMRVRLRLRFFPAGEGERVDRRPSNGPFHNEPRRCHLPSPRLYSSCLIYTARHRILADYLRSGDVIPLDERSTEWHQVRLTSWAKSLS